MNLDYFMKIQNAYGTKSRREKELAKVNRQMSKHFEDTFDTEEVLLNGVPIEMMMVHDTELNTYKKKIKTRHDDIFNLGDYVIWNDQTWLVTILDTDDKTWNRGYMYLCTVPLRWENENGEIIERYAYSEDFTKYSNGTYGNNVITIGDNQYGLTLPVDEETKKLHRDMCFPIDFDDAVIPDVYKLTNRKVNLSNYDYFNRGGLILLTLSYYEFNKYTDKRVTMNNGKEVWICKYQELDNAVPTTQTIVNNIQSVISGKNNVKIGFSRTFTVDFADSNGNEVSHDTVNFSWNIVSDINVVHEISGNKIKISIDDNEELIGSSFLLQCMIDGNLSSEITVFIEESF